MERKVHLAQIKNCEFNSGMWIVGSPAVTSAYSYWGIAMSAIRHVHDPETNNREFLLLSLLGTLAIVGASALFFILT